MNHFLTSLKKASPVILSCLSAAGTIATAVIAAKETPKAMQLLKEAREMDEDFSTKDAAILLAPIYLPAAAMCAATLLCTFGACMLNHKQQLALTSAYAMLERSYKEYKEHVTGIVGEEANHIIEKAVKLDEELDEAISWEEPRIFYEEHYKKFFERTMKQVFQTEFIINHYLASDGEITLNQFLEELKLEPVEGGDNLVWNYDVGLDQWGYVWADFDHRDYQTDDGMTVCEIITPFVPREEADRLL